MADRFLIPAGGTHVNPVTDIYGPTTGAAADGGGLEKVTKKGPTSVLLHQRDIFVLLWRVGETEMVSQVHLAGTIEFLSRGGTYMDLDQADIRGFKKVMDMKTRVLFRSELQGVRGVSPRHIKDVFDVLGNAEKEPFLFYKFAIE